MILHAWTICGQDLSTITVRVSNIELNDEVITQSLTFVATCNAIRYCGARPILLDVNKKNKGEEVLSYYKLDEENKKLYDEVEDEDENELEIGGSGILNILVKRIKKNNTKKARKNRI